MIYVIDFGSQTAHLITRRIKELGSPVKFIAPQDALSEIEKSFDSAWDKPQGIIFSGGPASVYEDRAPTINQKIFEVGVPILSICYGFQLTAHLLGGKVVSGKKEYGPSQLEIRNLPASLRGEKLEITKDLPKSSVVWMSHGDEIVTLPQGFEVVGSTEHVPFAFTEDKKRNIIGVLFHPEVEHTEWGSTILKNFLEICEVVTKEHVIDVAAIEQGIAEEVGEAYVIGAVSGGVDSTVAGVLTAKAIGNRFIPVYVDNGLMREGTGEHVKKIFTEIANIKPIVVNAVGETLEGLGGIEDPEEKRKIIGQLYIEIFEREMAKLISSGKNVKFLMQGTIYSDVIESQGTKHASKIKSHHNVAGLPLQMKLKLLEPLRNFYKDEVREIGKQLGISDAFIHKQPFPGPGYAVRIRGEVTSERLEKEKIADRIVLEELEAAGLLKDVFISFPVMTGAQSTAVKGDGRFFGEVVALRVVQSKDVMTAKWAHLPYEVLQKISSRIVNEIPGISRVVYDISTKPPATMEWE